jgi:hypothetical protein
MINRIHKISKTADKFSCPNHVNYVNPVYFLTLQLNFLRDQVSGSLVDFEHTISSGSARYRATRRSREVALDSPLFKHGSIGEG